MNKKETVLLIMDELRIHLSKWKLSHKLTSKCFVSS